MSGKTYPRAMTPEQRALWDTLTVHEQQYLHAAPTPEEFVRLIDNMVQNDRIMADLCRAQPDSWVEDRRQRLTTAQAERGMQPAKYTKLEWRRMNDASRAYSDGCVLRQLTRAQLGP